MRLKITILAIILLLAGLTFFSCRDKKRNAVEQPAAWVAWVTAAEAVSQDIPIYLDEIGSCAAYEAVTIRTQVTGKIVDINFTDGADVKKGDLLFTIDPRSYEATLKQAQANLVQSKAALELAKSEFERAKGLLPTGAMSKEGYDIKQNAIIVGEAKIQVDQAAIQIAPTIQLSGRSSKSLYQYTLQTPDTAELYKYAAIMEQKIQALPGFQDITSGMQITNPKVSIEIQRDKAATLGVNAEQIETALSYAYSSGQVSTILAPDNQYLVITELLPEYQLAPSVLSMLYVRSDTTGKLIPLNAVANFTTGVGPLTINHQGQFARSYNIIQPKARHISRRRC
jgi:multidrug efflux pump subunit AcrB